MDDELIRLLKLISRLFARVDELNKRLALLEREHGRTESAIGRLEKHVWPDE